MMQALFFGVAWGWWAPLNSQNFVRPLVSKKESKCFFATELHCRYAIGSPQKIACYFEQREEQQISLAGQNKNMWSLSIEWLGFGGLWAKCFQRPCLRDFPAYLDVRRNHPKRKASAFQAMKLYSRSIRGLLRDDGGWQYLKKSLGECYFNPMKFFIRLKHEAHIRDTCSSFWISLFVAIRDWQ